PGGLPRRHCPNRTQGRLVHRLRHQRRASSRYNRPEPKRNVPRDDAGTGRGHEKAGGERDATLAPQHALPVRTFVLDQRLRRVIRLGTDLTRKGSRAGDGHAGTVTEQRNTTCGIAEEHDTTLRPGIETDSTDGIEIEVRAVANPV